MVNRGLDSNGSLFQVCFTQNPDLDNKHVVFGCLANDESYEVLDRINSYGTSHGEPTEELRIVDCALIYPDPSKPIQVKVKPTKIDKNKINL